MAGRQDGAPASSLTLGAGVGVLREGFSFVMSRPRLLVLGAIPPLITSLLTIALLIGVGLYSDDLATWATPFADTWQAAVREPFRMLFAVILFAATVLVSVVVFSSLTLAIGAPIYDKISEAVESEAGGVPGRVNDPARVWVPRLFGQLIVTILQSMAIGFVLFLVGLIPVVGGVVAAILGALAGAFLVCRELIGGPAERRGISSLKQRRQVLNREPRFVLGFSIPVYLLLSLPFVSMAVFPAATAGGTILLRRILGQCVP